MHDVVPPKRGVGQALRRDQQVCEKKLVDSGMTLVKVAMFVSREDSPEEATARTAGRIPPSTGSTTRRASTNASTGRPIRNYQAVSRTRASTDYAPWYVVPCDKRMWYSRLATTELLIEALKRFNLS